MISAAVVGVMVHRLTPRTCIELVALLPLLVMCSSFVLRDERKPICGGGPASGTRACSGHPA